MKGGGSIATDAKEKTPKRKTRSGARKGVVEPTSATPVVQAPVERHTSQSSSSNNERGTMAVVVNLAGIKTTLDAIPDGTYPANLTSKKFAMSKANQPKCTLEFTFSSEAGEEIAGRKGYVECSLQPQALFKIKKAMIDMGVEPEDLEGPVDLDEMLGQLMGTEASIRVGHHEWEGSTRNDFYVVSPDSWSNN